MPCLISATLALLAQCDNRFAGEPLLKKHIRDSETLQKKFETPRPKETHEKRDFVTRHKSFRDFEIRSKVFEIHDFLGTIRHPVIKLSIYV